MKKAFLLAMVLACPLAAQAAGTPVCAGDTGGDKSVGVTAGMFIVNRFNMKCSTNVFLAYEEDATAVGVASASLKGKNIFAGGSSGGQVKRVAECASGVCNASSAADATAAALAGS
jgi:hypothetical protein